jgi:hypothetical protein
MAGTTTFVYVFTACLSGGWIPFQILIYGIGSGGAASELEAYKEYAEIGGAGESPRSPCLCSVQLRAPRTIIETDTANNHLAAWEVTPR